MQLPRGTFQYIKKDTILGGILEELQLMKFSGICTISLGSANGSLVFKSGKRILAEFQNITGDDAWNEFQKIFGEKVDAAVSAMDDTQIELSLEFNKTCRVGKGKTELSQSFSSKMDHILPVKKFPPVPHEKPLVTPVKTLQKPHVHEISSPHPIVTFETLQTPEPFQAQKNQTQQKKSPLTPPSQKTPKIHQQPPELLPGLGEPRESEGHPETPADDDSKSFESDIDTIETMNVDVMTSKIRGECKTLIKQLRLEHLTER